MTNRLILGIILLTTGCNTNNKSVDTIKAANSQVIIEDTVTNFFPVTSYLKGEIYGIKNGGITPVRKITIAGKTDSSWVHVDEFDAVFASFQIGRAHV